MECFHARELIQEKLEGELDAQLAHELKAHLVTCHKCRDFERGIEVLDTLMSREPLESAPEGFSARVIEAASRRRRRVLTYERKNLRVAAACVAAALVIAAILPFFVVLPEASALTEKIAAITPAITDTAQLAGGLADIAPPMPESAPTVADAVQGIQTTWDTLSDIEIPVLGLSGTLVLILAAFAAAAVALEAAYLALPIGRRK
jgi:anti-sigma factor RsiW